MNPGDTHLDFETASEVDLKEVGLMNYVTHPSTRVLLAAWTDPLTGEIKQRDFLDGFDDLLADLGTYEQSEYADSVGADEGRILAWNAPFEWAVMHYVLKWKHVKLERMYCVMAHALYRAFPAKLDAAAQVMLDRGKLDGAARLLRLWCFPTPENGKRPKVKDGDWDRFCLYNRLDVELERDIHRFLLDAGLPWPQDEQEVWLISERINWRGVPVDLAACKAAIAMHDRLTQQALAEIQRITGIENPNSPTQLAKWLDVASLDKKVMPRLIEQASGDRRRVLELRQQVALSAPKKYSVALAHANGGRVRNMLQYSGAGRTHRWSGRGIQPQNLRRGLKSDDEIARYWEIILRGDDAALARLGDPFVILANLVRTIIVPSGHIGRLNVADYASIEVVMLHWAAGDEPMLADIRAGLDAYKRYASQHWGIDITAVTKEQRTFSKPVVLGAGYGLGASTLVEYAAGMGVTMTLEEAQAAISTYRSRNKAVTRLWYGLEEAMRKSVAKPGAVFKYGHFAFRSTFISDDVHYTLMRLPGGTSITYWQAGVDEDDRLFYWGVNQYTGHWSKIGTWGGKLCENSIQSISRDVLVYGMQRAVERDLDIVLHVHDEMVNDDHCDEDEANLVDAMSPPPWCLDAPIHAAAFSCPRYRKD